MAITKMELLELVRNAEGGDVDFLREGVRVLAQALMEAEVSAQVGAEHGERASERRGAQRNGYRDRDWDTRAGTVELRISSCAPAATESGRYHTGYGSGGSTRSRCVQAQR